MKQHITEEQFNELSDEQQKVLFDFIGKRWFPNSFEQHRTSNIWIWCRSLHIGDMLEFLDENGGEKYIRISVARAPAVIEGFPRKWIVGQYDDGFHHAVMLEELCDALWEIVKEILNGKHT